MVCRRNPAAMISAASAPSSIATASAGFAPSASLIGPSMTGKRYRPWSEASRGVDSSFRRKNVATRRPPGFKTREDSRRYRLISGSVRCVNSENAKAQSKRSLGEGKRNSAAGTPNSAYSELRTDTWRKRKFGWSRVIRRRHQRIAPRTTSKPSYSTSRGRRRASDCATLPMPQPMSRSVEFGWTRPCARTRSASSSPTASKSPSPTNRSRSGGESGSVLPARKTRKSIQAASAYRVRRSIGRHMALARLRGGFPLVRRDPLAVRGEARLHVLHPVAAGGFEEGVGEDEREHRFGDHSARGDCGDVAPLVGGACGFAGREVHGVEPFRERRERLHVNDDDDLLAVRDARLEAPRSVRPATQRTVGAALDLVVGARSGTARRLDRGPELDRLHGGDRKHGRADTSVQLAVPRRVGPESRGDAPSAHEDRAAQRLAILFRGVDRLDHLLFERGVDRAQR